MLNEFLLRCTVSTVDLLIVVWQPSKSVDTRMRRDRAMCWSYRWWSGWRTGVRRLLLLRLVTTTTMTMKLCHLLVVWSTSLGRQTTSSLSWSSPTCSISCRSTTSVTGKWNRSDGKPCWCLPADVQYSVVGPITLYKA